MVYVSLYSYLIVCNCGHQCDKVEGVNTVATESTGFSAFLVLSCEKRSVAVHACSAISDYSQSAITYTVIHFATCTAV